MFYIRFLLWDFVVCVWLVVLVGETRPAPGDRPSLHLPGNRAKPLQDRPVDDDDYYYYCWCADMLMC